MLSGFNAEIFVILSKNYWARNPISMYQTYQLSNYKSQHNTLHTKVRAKIKRQVKGGAHKERF